MANGSELDIRPIPILSDNYVWRLRDRSSGAVAVVDPAVAGPVNDVLEAEGGRLDLVLLTHHHDDHIAEARQVAERYGARIVGAARDAARLPPLDLGVKGGDRFGFGDQTVEVIETDGHTRGHISFFLPSGPALLCGDTLFSLGCGRLLEGTPEEMFASLEALKRLPDDTLVCCGHEYTRSNARFALSIDPDNAALRRRAAEVERQRGASQPTLPSRLGDEKQANPFMLARDVGEFAERRAGKDRF
ncbi:hydroxyacylglutathione hydrolase [Acetobacteraceae bacterium KSS8]|uniref:Hydroxyacylglutathione hydrolase n=1 Tax=Endosaccharibacter trunci TaxID=2812733 RepID=A0ABT1W780_9PROT|nr:hydroxyacylglutathione hydrolase [Acetobacteraceae bacterium KSS8]